MFLFFFLISFEISHIENLFWFLFTVKGNVVLSLVCFSLFFKDVLLINVFSPTSPA